MSISHHTFAELHNAPSSFLPLLRTHTALAVHNTVVPREARSFIQAIYAARDEWSAAFDGTQFSLGKAWYVEYEEDREDEYFRSAQASNTLVENYLPGMQEFVLEIFTLLTGQPSQCREGWCGPGVHIFPAGNLVANQGGEPHFDMEGLTDEDIAQRVPALTLVIMLQAPEKGGGLALWDMLFDGRFDTEIEHDDLPTPLIYEYEVGDMLVIDSYRLHQIQPFTGTHDRISITAHGILSGGVWQMWF